MDDFENYCARLIQTALAKGWQEVERKALPYGRQFRLTMGAGSSAILNCYNGKKGMKFVVGGKDASSLTADLGQSQPGPGSDSADPDPFGLGWPRIGGDESGKGDFFGPLTAAVFLAREEDLPGLQSMGVRDCKSLSDRAVQRLAGLLERTGNGLALRLMPREYNERYSELGNLNLLLGELYSQCITRLRSRTGCSGGVVLIDQFTRDERALASALALPPQWRLELRVRGERDPVVAAASILARAEFLSGLEELGNEYGQRFPAGAGEPTIAAARAFKHSFGAGELAAVAKTHFATMKRL